MPVPLMRGRGRRPKSRAGSSPTPSYLLFFYAVSCCPCCCPSSVLVSRSPRVFNTCVLCFRVPLLVILSWKLQFLESSLRHRSEMVMYEAARAICNLPGVEMNDLSPAINVLQVLVCSSGCFLSPWWHFRHFFCYVCFVPFPSWVYSLSLFLSALSFPLLLSFRRASKSCFMLHRASHGVPCLLVPTCCGLVM